MVALNETVHHNLSAPVTPFVGRVRELQELNELLVSPGCRLLTLVGPGGIGKTRLAVEIASQRLNEFPDGVYFIALQTLESPDAIVSTIVETLDVQVDQCCEPKEDLIFYLSDKHMLLVLDNFEHLLDGADLVSDILAEAPGVKIIATSREALNLQEEYLWGVAGMQYPATEAALDASLDDFSAVRLFVQCAQRTRANFSLEDEKAGIIKICRLVDGMPLGIELAAAWVRVLSCDEIAREIERSLDFLKTRARNVLPRHQSMRVVLDHSWELLSEAEQQVFKRLAVFRGSFTRESAAAVAGASLAMLSALVDKSLLKRDHWGRYEMHELVRQYAEKQLNDNLDDSTETRDRHARYYMTFLKQQWERLLGSEPKEALADIEVDIRNIRPAWGWSTVHWSDANLDDGLDSLWFFCDTRGWYREGEKMLALAADALREVKTGECCQRVYGRVIARQGVLCNSLNRSDDARRLLSEALAIFEAEGDQREQVFALTRLGEVVAFEERLDEAEKYLTAAMNLAREIGDRWGEAFAMHWLSSFPAMHNWKEYCENCLRIYRQIGSQWGIALTLVSYGFYAAESDQYDEALQMAEEGLNLRRDIGIRWGVIDARDLMGYIYNRQGRYRDAVRCIQEALEIGLELHLPRSLAYSSYMIGWPLMGLGLESLAIDFFAVSYLRLYGVGSGKPYIDMDEDMEPELLARVAERARSIEPEATIKALLPQLVEQVYCVEDVPSAPTAGANGLTERELEILQLAAGGMSNRDIAERLILSPGTVKWYLSQVYSKFGVSSRTQAIAHAREQGLLA